MCVCIYMYVYIYIYIYISYIRAHDGLFPRRQVGGVLRVEHLIALEWVLPPGEVLFDPGRRPCVAESTLATSSTTPATLPLRTAVARPSGPKVEGPLMPQRPESGALRRRPHRIEPSRSASLSTASTHCCTCYSPHSTNAVRRASPAAHSASMAQPAPSP